MTNTIKKPTYLFMAVNSIRILKTRGGSSRQAIRTYMLSNYSFLKVSTIDRYLKNALRKGVETGVLIQNKQSFKLGCESKKIGK
jgi:hypothetical protein